MVRQNIENMKNKVDETDHPLQLAQHTGASLAKYFVAISRDMKSTSLYFESVKALGFEKTVNLIARGFCNDLGITNKEFKIILEQLLRMA